MYMEQEVLFDELPKKEARAIELFRTFEALALQYHPEGFFLAFSGGKDSVVIHELARMSGVKFKAHYHLTTVDPPELVYFIRSCYPDVEVEKPEITMWNLIVKKKMPPLRNARYCCEVLKEYGGEGRFTVTGVRWQESRKRAEREFVEVIGRKGKNARICLNNDNDEARRQVETCTLKGKRVLNPIIDWSEEDVWRFIRKYRLPYCILYTQGFHRIGCIGCPMAGTRNREMEFARYPTYRRAYVRAFNRLAENWNQQGQPGDIWKDGESIFQWWLYGSEKEELQVEGQIAMELEELMGEDAA